MDPAPYLARLALRLIRGTRALPANFLDRQAAWLAARQHADSGFGGRAGASDVYYTAFALRLAQLLDIAGADFWLGAAAFLRANSEDPADVIDVFSLLASRTVLELRGIALWCDACRGEREHTARDILERSRAGTGGWARTPGEAPTLYHTFLAALSYELLGETPGERDGTVDFVRSRRRKDGGFSDTTSSRHSGVNPSAAAVGTLSALGALDDDVREGAARFTASLQRPDGGFPAHADAPASDLLSTFTALATLADFERLRDVTLGTAGRYVKSLALAGGGFLAATCDDEADIEYNYYGIGTLALLADEAASSKTPSAVEGRRKP